MVSWSVVEHENPQYTRLADSLTMNSFAVVKDQERDRLISWTRIQNEHMPSPPYTELPNPGHFQKIEDKRESLLSGFYLDVENMFHNIRLPPHLGPLFPFKPVSYGHLPPSLQLTLKHHLGFKPSYHTLLRPLQRSLPMGFMWAVVIAHNFVRSCYLEAFSIFLRTSDNFSASQLPPKILELQHSTGTITLSSRLTLVLHINFLFVDWPDEQAISLQRIVEFILNCKNGFPIRRKKSSPLGRLEYDRLPFIGWVWHLKKGILRPKSEMLERSIKCTLSACSGELLKECVRSTVGRLLWICLGCRPMLSILYRTFHFLQMDTVSSDTLTQAVRRELRMVAKVSLLSYIKLDRPVWHRVIAFDASKLAGAVVYTDTSTDWVQYLASMSFVDRSEEENFPDERGLSVRDSYQAVLTRFVRTHRWKTAFTHRWRREEHINALEAHTAILGIDWALSFRVTGARILMLSDSTVAIGAFRKGRSSAAGLCLPCRKFAALSIAHDVNVRFLHIPSELNPADGPSRERPPVGRS